MGRKNQKKIIKNLSKKIKMEDKYEEYGCEFLNESECEEDLNEDGLQLEDVETKHFEEEQL